jgi:hypothetical protein
MQEFSLSITDIDGDQLSLSRHTDLPDQIKISIECPETGVTNYVWLTISNARALRSFLGMAIGQYEVEKWDDTESEDE